MSKSAQEDHDTTKRHGHLQQLASTMPKPTTPFRRAISAGPGDENKHTINMHRETPGTSRTPRAGPTPTTRPISAHRAAPTTPHAIRALRERATAARTPGHVRRRSGRVQRETPRDILRDLSKALARDTAPAEPSSQDDARLPRHSALDLPNVENEPDPTAPRLSMPLEDMYDEDSIHEAPPRTSLLPYLPDDADNGTIQSLEFGRRAISEDPRMMYPGRVSDRFADLNELEVDADEYQIDSTFINRRPTLGPQDLLERSIEEGVDDTTTELRALTGQRDGRISDVDLGVFRELDDEPDEPTFRFTIPPRIQAPIQEDTQNQTTDLLDQIIGENQRSIKTSAGNPSAEISTLGNDDVTGASVLKGWESDHGADDADLQAYREEESAMDRSLQAQTPERHPMSSQGTGRQRKVVNLSKFGLESPSVPVSTVKNLATGLMTSSGSKARVSQEVLTALVQASDFFFEQASQDLAAYAQHGGRKAIEESDVVALMKRTRQINSTNTSFSLAQHMLPRELLQQLRMEPPQKLKGQRLKRKRLGSVDDDEG